MTKTYRLAAERIRPVAVGYGSCFATDRITVDGAKVGYCYREAPDDELDSGWRFFAGDETPAYMDEAANIAIHDVNTIANYDPEITALIEAPVGSAFERGEDGSFVEVDVEDGPDDEPGTT